MMASDGFNAGYNAATNALKRDHELVDLLLSSEVHVILGHSSSRFLF